MRKALAAALAALAVAWLPTTPSRATSTSGRPYARVVPGGAVHTTSPAWVLRGDVQARRGQRHPRPGPPGGRPPHVVRSFPGRYDGRSSPPDATGAVGPSGYVQLVNRGVAIYNRNGIRVFSG